MDNNQEIPFYKMNLQELKAYFIKENNYLERRKTRRRPRGRRRKTAKK